MDRSILEGDPHSVIEAMTIAGYTVGADQDISMSELSINCRGETYQSYSTSARYGLLGKNILGTDFSFDLELRLGAGHLFVVKRLLLWLPSRVIVENQDQDRLSCGKGVVCKPTLLNNVETYANIPQIILKGPKWFRALVPRGVRVQRFLHWVENK